MSGPQRGYLLIADITGYTRYLSSSELEHAQGVLHTLMELLIEQTKPPLVVNQLEGDAVFSYGIVDASLGSQTFVEMIENTYVAFRRAIDLMVVNTTCGCDACANIRSLDLKFFVHHGRFTLQRLHGRDELLGSDVITVHRLTKNRVPQATGFTAYTLYTAAAIEALALDGFADTLRQHAERYDHLGSLDVFVQNMEPVWTAKQDALRIEIADDDVLVQVKRRLPVPLALAWEIITDPQYRAVFLNTVHQKTLDRRNGRMAPGSVYQCFHLGDRVTTQTVLDWHAFEQMTTEDTTPIPKATVLIQFKLAPDGPATIVEATASKARGPALNRFLCNVVGRYVLRSNLERGITALAATVAEQLADGTIAVPDESAIATEDIGASVAEALRQPRT